MGRKESWGSREGKVAEGVPAGLVEAGVGLEPHLKEEIITLASKVEKVLKIFKTPKKFKRWVFLSWEWTQPSSGSTYLRALTLLGIAYGAGKVKIEGDSQFFGSLNLKKMVETTKVGEIPIIKKAYRQNGDLILEINEQVLPKKGEGFIQLPTVVGVAASVNPNLLYLITRLFYALWRKKKWFALPHYSKKEIHKLLSLYNAFREILQNIFPLPELTIKGEGVFIKGKINISTPPAFGDLKKAIQLALKKVKGLVTKTVGKVKEKTKEVVKKISKAIKKNHSQNTASAPNSSKTPTPIPNPYSSPSPTDREAPPLETLTLPRAEDALLRDVLEDPFLEEILSIPINEEIEKTLRMLDNL